MERKEQYHQSEFRMLTGKWWKIWHRNVTTWQTYTYFLFAACKYIFLTCHHCLCFIYVLFNRQRWNLDVPLGACFHPARDNKCFESWILMWFSLLSDKFIVWSHAYMNGTLWQFWYLSCKQLLCQADRMNNYIFMHTWTTGDHRVSHAIKYVYLHLLHFFRTFSSKNIGKCSISDNSAVFE